MTALGNDLFRGSFLPDRLGPWECDVTGWIDHFDTLREGIVKKAGAWFSFDGDQLGQGREAAKRFIRENPDIALQLHTRVLEAVRGAVERGLTFGAPCEAEIALAELVVESYPAVEMVRFVSSGTARGSPLATNRSSCTRRPPTTTDKHRIC